MTGRRRPDGTAPTDLQPGDFCRSGVRHGEQSFLAWWVCSPNDLLGRLSMPADVTAGRVTGAHHVEEHGDGAISVEPQPGNSNSIKIEGWNHKYGEERAIVSWHGYLRHGVWDELGA